MKTIDSDLIVGLLLLCGITVLVYASLHRGQVGFGQAEGYTVQAEFTNAGGLQEGAPVEIAGVDIGRVTQVKLTDMYQALVILHLNSTVVLKEDAKATIKSVGLIGERYIDILPGASANQIAPGGNIRNTEAPVDLQETITQFIFGNVETDSTSNGIQ